MEAGSVKEKAQSGVTCAKPTSAKPTFEVAIQDLIAVSASLKNVIFSQSGMTWLALYCRGNLPFRLFQSPRVG